VTLANNWTNPGTVTLATDGALTVANPLMKNTGMVDNQGTITVATYEQAAGTTWVHNTGNIQGNLNLTGGVLKGDGTVSGMVTQTGGTLEPGNSPGIFHIGNGYSLTNGTLDIEVASLTLYDQVAMLGGNVTLGPAGQITIDLSEVPANDPMFSMQRVGFDIIEIGAGQTITTQTITFNVIDGGPLHYESFDNSTGTVYLAQVPEPTVTTLVAAVGGLTLLRRRRRVA